MSPARLALVASAALLAIGCVEEPQRPFSGPPYGMDPYGPTPAYPYGPPPMAPVGGWNLAGPSPGAARAVAFAYTRIGTPYCWGGNGPSCYDCSGFTRAAWAMGGRAIPRSSDEQLAKLTPIPLNLVQPGDILWRPGHVGLYVGQGWVIAATHTGDVVRYQPASGFQRAVRP